MPGVPVTVQSQMPPASSKHTVFCVCVPVVGCPEAVMPVIVTAVTFEPGVPLAARSAPSIVADARIDVASNTPPLPVDLSTTGSG